MDVPSSDGYSSWLTTMSGTTPLPLPLPLPLPTTTHGVAAPLPAAMPWTAVGAPKESTTAKAWPVSRSAVRPAMAITSPRPSTMPRPRPSAAA